MSRTSFKLWGLSSTIRINSFATEHRNRERECRANNNLALHPNPPPVQLDKLPTQRQPEPSALHLLVRRPDLPELLEDRLLILGRDADSGVADRHLDRPIHRRGPHLDPAALRRELDRVGEQIQHDLPDLSLVRANLA